MNRFLLPVLLTVFIVSSIPSLQAQNKSIDISRIHLVEGINDRATAAYMSCHTSFEAVSDTLQFTSFTRSNVRSSLVGRKLILKFSAHNSSDSTVSVWFFPGLSYWNIDLYRVQGGRLQQLQSILPDNEDRIGYRLLTLAPHDSAVYYASLRFVKTYLNTINPRLINSEYLSSFVSEQHVYKSYIAMVTYLFCGLLLMMVLYSLSIFFQGGNRDFLYYSGYAFFVGLMLFTKTIYSFQANRIGFFLEEYLDFIMQCIGHGFYMLFMQKYLETKTKYPFLHKMYNFGNVILLLAMGAYTYLHYFTDNFSLENQVENITKMVLLVLIVVFLVYGAGQWKDKLLRYLFWGNLSLLIFSLFSMMLLVSRTLSNTVTGLFASSLFHYELGLFFELVFFLAALNYKNRQQIMLEARERERLKADNQMKEYEKEIAVYKAQQDERQRISADMHDELGSGMTAIRLMSEIARDKMKEQTPAEIDRISQSADEVLNKMNAIIWSMNSGNDSLDNLISYIRSYALDYFDNTPIECRVKVPAYMEDREITGDKRRNVFLCVKESLNNVLKHSKASQVDIEIEMNSELYIRIADNGIGIDMQKIRRFGNGLKNIKRRMESIGGSYDIGNEKGTVTLLVLPL